MALDPADLDRLDKVVRMAVREEFSRALEESTPSPMATKWEGGKIVLWPKEEGGAGKEIPMDAFFHKIVMVRDRLRTLEQQVNSHKTLTEGEKVHLQQYITRCYGSLTTFNVLFRDKSDHFVGASSGSDRDDA